MFAPLYPVHEWTGFNGVDWIKDPTADFWNFL